LNDQDVVHIYEILLAFHDAAPQGEEPSSTEDEPEATTSLALPDLEQAADDDSSTRVVNIVDATAGRHSDVASEAKLQAILEINRNLGNSLAIDEMLPQLLDGLFKVFPQADRGYVVLVEGSDDQLVPRAVKDRYNRTGARTALGLFNRKEVQRVISRREAILSVDDPEDTGDSVFDFEGRSTMCAPLMGPSREPLGVVHIDTNDPQFRFNQDDLEVLVDVAIIAGQSVEYARVHEARLQQDRRDLELETARSVQLHFLPRTRPAIPGYRFYDHYHSANEVGGDYFGYIPLADGRLAAAVGDVAGKGVSAALLMARLCSEVHYCLAATEKPADAVGYLNQKLSDMPLDDRFITFVLGVLDPRNHSLTVVNAGHVPPLWRFGNTKEVEPLLVDDDSPPLGVDARSDYRQVSVSLEPGDSVVMYTDGVNDAASPGGQTFGHRRIREMIARGPDDVAEMGLSLLAELKRFTGNRPQADDLCLLCLARTIGPSKPVKDEDSSIEFSS